MHRPHRGRLQGEGDIEDGCQPTDRGESGFSGEAEVVGGLGLFAVAFFEGLAERQSATRLRANAARQASRLPQWVARAARRGLYKS